MFTFTVFCLLSSIHPSEVFSKLKIPPKACPWGNHMTSHSSPREKAPCADYPFLIDPLQSYTRVPTYFGLPADVNISPVCLQPDLWLWEVSVAIRAKQRHQSETHFQKVEWVKTFLFHILGNKILINPRTCFNLEMFSVFTLADLNIWHFLIFSTSTLLSFSQAAELMWHALLQQTGVTATLFSLHPEHPSFEFPSRPHHNGEGANGWELSCPAPNCCQNLALLQHKRYKCLAVVECQNWF